MTEPLRSSTERCKDRGSSLPKSKFEVLLCPG
jgi:hypothetical protein